MADNFLDTLMVKKPPKKQTKVQITMPKQGVEVKNQTHRQAPGTVSGQESIYERHQNKGCSCCSAPSHRDRTEVETSSREEFGRENEGTE